MPLVGYSELSLNKNCWIAPTNQNPSKFYGLPHHVLSLLTSHDPPTSLYLRIRSNSITVIDGYALSAMRAIKVPLSLKQHDHCPPPPPGRTAVTEGGLVTALPTLRQVISPARRTTATEPRVSNGAPPGSSPVIRP